MLTIGLVIEEERDYQAPVLNAAEQARYRKKNWR